jgi:putative cell wall binding repeat protein
MRRFVPTLALVLASCLGAGCGQDQSPAPTGGAGGGEEAARELGFPAFATKNTTRVGGEDPVAVAAGVALATFPPRGEQARPQTIVVADVGDWHAGLASAVFAAAPLRAPILLSEDAGTPDATRDAVDALRPVGDEGSGDAQAILIGGVGSPGGLQAKSATGADPAELAANAAALRDRFLPDPDHVLLVSSDEPAFAMPAAAWAARSGDPVLFVAKDAVPRATITALRRYRRIPAYVLGPASVVSEAVIKKLQRISPLVRRVGGPDPVRNAIAFARYRDGTFGWNVNDPGHGFVIANTTRPLDAAAAAPLSASGTWGPLLVTDTAVAPPEALSDYLLNVKPGYRDDPTRAVYNHIWVIGDDGAIGVGFQAELDALAEVVRIRSGLGEPQSQSRAHDEPPSP